MEPLVDLSRCSGTFDVLLFLLQKGKTLAKGVMRGLNMKRGTFYSAVGLLEKYRLVFKVEEKGFPTRASYDLTLTGENLAKHLIPLKDILSDTIEALGKELLDLDQQRRTKKNLERILELSVTMMGLSLQSGEWDESLKFSQRVLELSERLDSPSDMERAHWNIGLVHQGRSQYEQALESFNKSLKIATELKDPIRMSENEYSIGAIFERWGRYDEAMRELETVFAQNKITIGAEGLAAFRKEYSRVAQLLGPLLQRASLVDTLIDLSVYRLYGLAEDDIAIIEDLALNEVRSKYQWPSGR